MHLTIMFSIMTVAVLARAQITTPVYSQADNQNAIQQTQHVLTDTKLRQGAMDTDQARTADRNVEITSMGNANVKNDIYGVSADLVPWLADQGKGDASGMQKLLQDAQTNPQALENFYNRMPAAQKDKIKAISQQIENLRSGAANSVQASP